MNEILRRLLFLPPQASSLARELDHLHYSVILVTMGGATLVALSALYFLLKYRSSKQPEHRDFEPRSTHPGSGLPLSIEISAIGFLFALFVGWWLIGYRQFIRLAVPPANSLVIYLTAKQWMWTFAYPNGTGSNGVLYVPLNRPVKLVMSSRDVIHSFYVPEFRVKKDAIPGQVTTVWFEATRLGVYQLLCAEYCGNGHSTMRAQVLVLSEADYARRIEHLDPLEIAGPEYVEPALQNAAQRVPLTLAQMGERVAATRGCLRCHTADGTPHIGPTWAGLFGSMIPLANGGNVVADEAYLTESMMDPHVKVHAGFQAVMPSYQGLLSPAETGALLEYLRVLRDYPAEQRSSPLVPRDAPPLRLPTESDRSLQSEHWSKPSPGEQP